MKEKICLAIDAMGGDFGPKVVVPAVLRALKKYPDTRFILFGDESLVLPMIPRELHSSSRIEMRHTTEVVTMEDSPAYAVRHKKNSSMRKAIDAVKENEADGCISSGNTGAMMATGRFVLGMCDGISRPAIIHPMPSSRPGTNTVYVLDLGANIECSAEHLYQFALMGNAFAKCVAGIEKPKIGLLNIGTEDHKGTDAIKEASTLIKGNSDIDYHGYVEGYDIYRGPVDVVVCDGFAGNVAIKTSEGLGEFIVKEIRKLFSSNIFYKALSIFTYPILKSLSKKFDPNNYNGAALLGLNGAVFKSHGGSKEKAFLQAITSAREGAKNEIIKNLQAQLKQNS